jgi:hypothetical protein
MGHESTCAWKPMGGRRDCTHRGRPGQQKHKGKREKKREDVFLRQNLYDEIKAMETDVSATINFESHHNVQPLSCRATFREKMLELENNTND